MKKKLSLCAERCVELIEFLVMKPFPFHLYRLFLFNIGLPSTELRLELELNSQTSRKAPISLFSFQKTFQARPFQFLPISFFCVCFHFLHQVRNAFETSSPLTIARTVLWLVFFLIPVGFFINSFHFILFYLFKFLQISALSLSISRAKG